MRIIVAAAGVLGLAFAGCANRSGGTRSIPPRDWRLVPEATVLGDKRQFFVYGRNLDSSEITAHSSVTLEKGPGKPDGRVLTVYLQVRALDLADTARSGEKPGLRRIRVKTPDTTVVLDLKVVDETADP